MGSKLVKSVVLWISVCLVAGLSIFSFTNFFFVKKETNKLVLSSQYNVVENSINYLNSYFVSKFRPINFLAGKLKDKDMSEDEILSVLKTGQESADFALFYMGFEENGRMLRSNNKNQWPSDGYDPRARGWYKQTAQNGKNTITDAYITSTGNHLAISLTAPIYKNGKLSSVVASDILLEGLSDSILGMKHYEEEKIIAIDQKGRMLINQDKELILKELPLTKDLINIFKDDNKKILGELRTHKFTENDETMVAACLTEPSSNLLVCSVVPLSINDKSSNALLQTQVGLSVAFIVLISLMLMLIMSYKLKPIKDIELGLVGFFNFLHNKTNKVTDIKVASNDELGKMAKMINEGMQEISTQKISETQFLKSVNTFIKQIENGKFATTLDDITTNNPTLEELKEDLANLQKSLKIAISSNSNDVLNLLTSYKKHDFTSRLDDSGMIASGVSALGEEIANMLKTNLTQAEGLQQKA
ncbi:hypothetical protein CCAL13119_08735, partial [Campylobacter sp. RM13119]